jgi:N-acetyl-gamma-glutamyl-phosphate reductase
VAIRLFIDGAAGTTGLEIRERLQGRSEFDLIVLDDAQRKDESARRDALHAADIAILCLPDEAAKEAVTLAEGSGTRIIDASSAHRVAEGWTYGFPELIGHGAIANARFVSNPGCYPTGFLALVAPLVKAKLIPARMPLTVNAVSGYSGGGKALIDEFEQDSNIALRAYGLQSGHKHLPEMQQVAKLKHPPVFSPSVVPAFRGMLVDVPLPAYKMGYTRAHDIREAWEKAFAGSEIVDIDNPIRHMSDEVVALLLLKNAEPWDGIELFAYGNDAHIRLIAHLDNLGKGASGAAIQNLNIMCGLPETTGLRL